MGKRIDNVVVIGVLASLAGMAQPAAAQWYGVATIGASRANLADLVIPVATNPSYGKDQSSYGYKLQAGHRLNESFALEGGYVNLGKFRATNDATYPGGAGGRALDTKADGWNLFAVGFVPLSGDFSLYGKLGTLYSTTKADLSVTSGVALPAGTITGRKRSEWNWAYGLGVQYEINKTLSVRGEWEHYAKLGNEGNADSTGQFNVNLYSVGLNFKF